MDENEKLIRVYTGTEITVKLLQAELEKYEISSIIENNFKSGITAGFVGGMQSGIDLFIKASICSTFPNSHPFSTCNCE